MIPCLALEEVIAEKIRAASQRSKIRDLYDLSELAGDSAQRQRPTAEALAAALAIG